MSDYEWVRSSIELFRKMSENAEKNEQEYKQDKEQSERFSLAMENYLKGKKQAYTIAADHLESMVDIYAENVVITEEES